MGWISKQGQVHSLARDGWPVIRGPQVVLHISRASEGALIPRLDPGKLAEDLLHGLAHHISQHIQPPCVT